MILYGKNTLKKWMKNSYSIPIFVEEEKRKITGNENLPYNFLLEGG